MNSKILNQVKFSIILLVFCFSCTKEKEAETAGLKTNIQALKKVSEDLSFKIVRQFELKERKAVEQVFLSSASGPISIAVIKPFVLIYLNGIEYDDANFRELSMTNPNFLTFKSAGYEDLIFSTSSNLTINKRGYGYIIKPIKGTRATISVSGTLNGIRSNLGTLGFKIID